MNYPLSEQQMYSLAFEQLADDTLANRSFTMGRGATDRHTLYDYKLAGFWVFQQEPSLFWMDPPAEGWRFFGHLRVCFYPSEDWRNQLHIRPPYTTETLQAPAAIEAALNLAHAEVLQIAQMNRQGQALNFWLDSSLETEARGREVNLLGLVHDLAEGKPPEKPCSFKVSSWGCSVASV
jgi:hypothetical protein